MVKEMEVRLRVSENERVLWVNLYQKMYVDMSREIIYCVFPAYFFGRGRTLSRSFLLLVEVLVQFRMG